MALFRWLALPAIVASILIGFSFVNGPEDALVDVLLDAQKASAQIVTTATSEPALPTPTDIPQASPTLVGSTDTATVDASTTASVTATPTAPPTFTGTPITSPTDTATPSSSQTPTPSATPGTVLPTPTLGPGLPPLSDVPDAPRSVIETVVGQAAAALPRLTAGL